MTATTRGASVATGALRLTRVAPGLRRPGTPDSPTLLEAAEVAGGIHAARWLHAADHELTYPGLTIDRTIGIAMSDGVTLRATLLRPATGAGTAVDTELPLILNISPYNRAVMDALGLVNRVVPKVNPRDDRGGTGHGNPLDMLRAVSGGLLDIFTPDAKLVRSGYCQLVVDARGTGGSLGSWDMLGLREQQDTLEIIEWARQQSWCNGRVGMGGISYSAINALQAASHHPEGLDAVFSVAGCADMMRDAFLTGGAPTVFIPGWMAAVNALKWLPNPLTGARDVVSGHAWRWLRSRLQSPATEMGSLLKGLVLGDDPRLYDDVFYTDRNPRIEEITAPTFVFGAWHDVFAHSGPDLYRRLQLSGGRKKLVMSEGYHFDMGTGFGERFAPPRLDVLQRAWYDKWLKGIDNGIDEYTPVALFQQGGRWSAPGAFPQPAATPQRLYLTETRSGTAPAARFDGSLAPTPDARTRTVRLAPLSLRTLISRDTAQATGGLSGLLGPKFNADASIPERAALSFTTAAVGEEAILSGALNAHLRVIAAGTDALWAVTVNDVAPDGTSRILSNGALLSSHRAIDTAASEYLDGELISPRHFLTKAARLPVSPGVPHTLDIDLVPIEAVLAPGHRLRIDIYPADVPRFIALPTVLLKSRFGRQKLVLDPNEPSYLTVPVVGQPGW